MSFLSYNLEIWESISKPESRFSQRDCMLKCWVSTGGTPDMTGPPRNESLSINLQSTYSQNTLNALEITIYIKYSHLYQSWTHITYQELRCKHTLLNNCDFHFPFGCSISIDHSTEMGFSVLRFPGKTYIKCAWIMSAINVRVKRRTFRIMYNYWCVIRPTRICLPDTLINIKIDMFHV